MNENVDIFICTHKDFDNVVSNDVYKVIDSRDLRDKFKIFGTLTDVELSEWYHMYWLVDNVQLKDYVGICHYRRYFDFKDDIPNIDEIFKEYDVITRTPIDIKTTIANQYAYCHNIEDLIVMGNVIKDKFLDYYETFADFLKHKEIIPCNMVIMRKDDFLKFIEFTKDFVKEVFWRIGIDVYKRVYENEEKYLKTIKPNSMPSYQIRLITFLLERLTNMYILKNFKNVKAYDVVVTENKYNLKNNTI